MNFMKIQLSEEQAKILDTMCIQSLDQTHSPGIKLQGVRYNIFMDIQGLDGVQAYIDIPEEDRGKY